MARSEYAERCSTKAKRAALAKEIEALATECGAKVTDETISDYDDRAIRLCLSFGPYRVNMRFDGALRGAAFLGHWHVDTRSDATYPDLFGFAIQGSRNDCHRRKATTCAYTLAAFKQSLRDGFECLKVAS